ncbi:hypothetical protein AO953_33000 [Pseudomonas aeruginosa]|nr:hypothetical protein AO953_33000 [Pseudomonas aeruginosa]
MSVCKSAACICERFTASVAAVPARTFVICRSPPAAPTDTVFARSATDPAPSATDPAAVALDPLPTATEPSPASTPRATE